LVTCTDLIGKKQIKGKLKITGTGAYFSRSRSVFGVYYKARGQTYNPPPTHPIRYVVTKAPRKRGHPKSQTTRDQVALWDLAISLIAVVDGLDVAIALCESKGTAFYARDILLMAMYGNYIAWPGHGWAPNGPASA
jgi:hypothetical protein